MFWIFFVIFLPGSVMNEIQDENFFVSFSAYLIPFGLKIMPERGFLIFWIILLFFSEFSSEGRVWTEFGTEIFLSLCYLIPFSLKIIQERGFLIFWILLLFFSEFSFSGRLWTEFGTKIFLSLSRPISSSLGSKYCRKEVF